LGINIHPVGYEDLIINPRDEMEALLEHCGLPTDRLEACVAAMQRDSQGDTDWSKEKLKAHRPEKFTPEQLASIDARFAKIGLPPADKIKEVLTPAAK